MINRICEHSVLTSALKGFPVLDAGCRGFGFSDYFASRGHRLIALDAAKDIVAIPEGIEFLNIALCHQAGPVRFSTWRGAESNKIIPGLDDRAVMVEGKTISDLMRELNILHWDVVKMDIEGAEYDILMKWPGPISNQISIEFHEHSHANPLGPAYYPPMFAHLAQWYRVEQHPPAPMTDGGTAYFDTLLVLKDLK